MSSNGQTKFGLLAEFANPGELLHAAKKVRDEGYNKFDCYSPFPIHGMDGAMDLKRSPLGFIIAVIALFAVMGGVGLQYWANAVAYPFVISGKPFFSYPAYAPVGFAIAILTSGICTVVIMLAINGLPRFHHPIFYSENFKRATDDGFFMSVDSDDGKYDEASTKKFLESIGASNVETLMSEEQE